MLKTATAAFGVLAAVLLGGCDPEKGNANPQKSRETSFAADREGEGKLVKFDGKRALDYLDDICALGPRISGSAGMKKQQELLIKHFAGLGGKVRKQTFTARQKSQPRPVEMTNLIISWYPERKRRVVLCSHYDTRPIADQEPDARNWHKPFLSANDGGSGVAFLMELAQHVKDLPCQVGVDFVLFDGEEYIFDPGDGKDKYFFGSEHFARQYLRERSKYRYAAAILLDMIGGKGARFPAEGNSFLKAGALVEQVWKIAADLGCRAFTNRVGQSVMDDHLALNAAGIPAIDIIDFNYPHWHRLTDLPENCSRDSLEQVARVLTVWLQRVK
jgi:hypothetical protein